MRDPRTPTERSSASPYKEVGKADGAVEGGQAGAQTQGARTGASQCRGGQF